MLTLCAWFEQMLLVADLTRDESVVVDKRIKQQGGSLAATLIAKQLVVAAFAKKLGNESIGMVGA